MGLSVLFFALCVILGGVAWLALRRPQVLAEIGATLKEAELKRFSPKNTLFIFGPSLNHPPCRLQRRLLKPAVAALIRDDVVVMEVYGDLTPRKNGEDVDWLDPSLLRHAMRADDGFCVIFVDGEGKTLLRSAAPMLAADILDRIGIDAPIQLTSPADRKKSAVLRRLRAA
jgi:hypothetical protein